MNNFNIITLCGSTRFKESFLEVASKLSLEGKIVLMPHTFTHSDGIVVTNEQAEVLRKLHNAQIELGKEIYVIDVDGYIGESTREEIEYARTLGKTVRYHSKEEHDGHKRIF